MAWWLEEINIGGSQGPTYQVVQSDTKPDPSQVITGEHTNVTVTGPFSSQAAAQAKIPSGAHTGPYTPQFAGQATPQAPSLPTGLNAIGDFFARLTEGNTWLRIGEGLLGIILIAVGLARITNAVPAATRIARTVGAVGVAA